MGGKRGRGSKAAAAAKEGTRASKLSGGGGPPAVREVGDAGFDQGKIERRQGCQGDTALVW